MNGNKPNSRFDENPRCGEALFLELQGTDCLDLLLLATSNGYRLLDLGLATIIRIQFQLENGSPEKLLTLASKKN